MKETDEEQTVSHLAISLGVVRYGQTMMKDNIKQNIQ